MDYTALPPQDLIIALQQLTTTSSHARLNALFAALLPAGATHQPLIYHTPRRQTTINRLVLSVTATLGIYPHLNANTALFLHRPWDLDRRRLTGATLVLTSHQRLDELLTTGHNTPLLRRLGCTGRMVPIAGYKHDPTRKMGLVARLPADGETLSYWTQRITREFGALDDLSGVVVADGQAPMRFIACMNAFEPGLIDQSLSAAQQLSPDPITPKEIIYLTGQSRPLGAAHADALGMPVLFAGHRRAEVWAINWLADIVRGVMPDVDVLVVDEEKEEEEMQRRKKEAREFAKRNGQDRTLKLSD
ncbi:hypothetical protein NCC49_000865 [Naganishia albida]|nr:hypothetical protein NCC49_000865 [Naganishia albida]